MIPEPHQEEFDGLLGRWIRFLAVKHHGSCGSSPPGLYKQLLWDVEWPVGAGWAGMGWVCWEGGEECGWMGKDIGLFDAVVGADATKSRTAQPELLGSKLVKSFEGWMWTNANCGTAIDLKLPEDGADQFEEADVIPSALACGSNGTKLPVIQGKPFCAEDIEEPLKSLWSVGLTYHQSGAGVMTEPRQEEPELLVERPIHFQAGGERMSQKGAPTGQEQELQRDQEGYIEEDWVIFGQHFWKGWTPSIVVVVAAICSWFLVLVEMLKGIGQCSCRFERSSKTLTNIPGPSAYTVAFPASLLHFCLLALLLVPCAAAVQSTITTSAGNQPNDVSWAMVCSGGSELEGGAPFFGCSNATSGENCTLHMRDGAGDSWNGAHCAGLGQNLTR